jgi:endonuclease YncB( thermonuclease family)
MPLGRGTGWGVLALVLAGLMPASAQSVARKPAAPPAATASAGARCAFETLGAARLARVLDARTLALDDGREIRLAGLDILSHAEADAAEARALGELLAGREITLKRLGEARDRYGRPLVHLFWDENGRSRWLQEEIVAAGRARVTRIGDPICAAALYAREQTARAGKLGLWADPLYSIPQAEDVSGILERRGRFAIVEGRIVSVRESGGTIYVNFGRRWSEDFTVTIAKRHERAFAAAGTAPNALSGRLVRIRGWIEERGGPWVDAARPEQIELIER